MALVTVTSRTSRTSGRSTRSSGARTAAPPGSGLTADGSAASSRATAPSDHLGDCRELRAERTRVRQQQLHPAARIVPEKRRDLVAAEIEDPHGRRGSSQAGEQRAQHPRVVRPGGPAGRVEERELRPDQARALRARGEPRRHLGRSRRVHEDADPAAVGGDRGQRAVGALFRARVRCARVKPTPPAPAVPATRRARPRPRRRRQRARCRGRPRAALRLPGRSSECRATVPRSPRARSPRRRTARYPPPGRRARPRPRARGPRPRG